MWRNICSLLQTYLHRFVDHIWGYGVKCGNVYSSLRSWQPIQKKNSRVFVSGNDSGMIRLVILIFVCNGWKVPGARNSTNQESVDSRTEHLPKFCIGSKIIVFAFIIPLTTEYLQAETQSWRMSCDITPLYVAKHQKRLCVSFSEYKLDVKSWVA